MQNQSSWLLQIFNCSKHHLETAIDQRTVREKHVLNIEMLCNFFLFLSFYKMVALTKSGLKNKSHVF